MIRRVKTSWKLGRHSGGGWYRIPDLVVVVIGFICWLLSPLPFFSFKWNDPPEEGVWRKYETCTKTIDRYELIDYPDGRVLGHFC